jgi:hypothetical protein
MFKSFLPKIVQIPTSALPLAFMATVGYLPHVGGQPQEQGLGVLVYMKFIVILSFASSVTAVYIKSKYPLKTDAHLEELVVGISTHREGRPYPDPITGVPYQPLQLEADEEETVSLLYHFKIAKLGSFFIRPIICHNQDVRCKSCSQRSVTTNASGHSESETSTDPGKESSNSDVKVNSASVEDTVDGIILEEARRSSGTITRSSILTEFVVDSTAGTQALTQFNNKQLFICITFLLLSSAGTGFTMPLIENETWQFVPTLSVILVGLCTTLTLFACLRKRAADRLLQLAQEGALRNDLVTRVLWHRAIVAEVGVEQDTEIAGAKRAASSLSSVARSVRSLADVLTAQSMRSIPGSRAQPPGSARHP